MSKRAWLFVLALGLTIPALSGQAQEQAQNEQGQADGEEKPSLTFVVPVDVIEGKAEARKRSESESSQRDIDDLIAQQGMNSATQDINSATQDMRYYAYLQTWLIGIGTLLLILTLYLTRQANSAANRSVSVTGEMFERQLRAYIAVFNIDNHYFVTIGQGEIEVGIPIKNVGAIPASEVVYNGTLYIKRGSDILAFVKMVDEHGGMAPNATAIITGSIEVPISKLEAWGECDLYIQGRFFYKNGFNKMGVTGISMWIDIENGRPKQTSHYTQHGNELF